MLNLLKLLLSLKIKFNKNVTEISYKGLTLLVTEKDVTVLAKRDIDLKAGRDLMLDAGCYIGLDSDRAEIESLQTKEDAPKQTSESCLI